MRICYHCGQASPGQPLFCTQCGRSYNLKLCPRLHPNRRDAEACSVCGSRNLSTPQERVPVWFKSLMVLSGAIPGILLLVLSTIYIGYFIVRLIATPSDLLLPMLLGLALSLAWSGWIQIPFVLVRLLKRRRGS
jgi:RNA polymerase subunit RPABC4/transcription elongation factor Spt4